MSDSEVLKRRMAHFYATTDSYQRKLIKRFDYVEKNQLKAGSIDIMRLASSHQRVLDCGCGSGSLCIFLSLKLNKKIYGIDISNCGIEIAKNNALKANAKCDFKVADMQTKIPFPDNFFDLIIMHEVIEHLPDPEMVIGEINRVLKVHGKFVLVSPNLLIRSSIPTIGKKFFQWFKMIYDTQYLPKTLIAPDLNNPLVPDADAVYLSNPVEIRRMLILSNFLITKNSFLFRCSFIAQKKSLNKLPKL